MQGRQDELKMYRVPTLNNVPPYMCQAFKPMNENVVMQINVELSNL